MWINLRQLITFAVFIFPMSFSPATARAVNISNTWMLPEEDFPVFYRYFRDRISWYEADAVCQFHHANLVTADTSSQYDAIRAYLKELDITDNVWIGLSKKTEDSEFTWSDSRILSGEGHWREALPVGDEPLCVTVDPTADFLWKPYTCGGPEAASFICELPVPNWALGQKGCLLTELPSLTVLYIPEQMALELTSDCGLDGTKKITCKGDADHEEILKQLTCTISSEDDFDEKSSTRNSEPSASTTDITDLSSEDLSAGPKTTRSWVWTSNTVEGYEMSTRNRRETEDPLGPSQATIYYRKLDVTEPIPALHVSTSSNYDTEATVLNTEEEISANPDKKHVNEQEIDSQGEKPSQNESQIIFDVKLKLEDDEVAVTAEARNVESLEDIGEYPSAINQGQLFSIIENGTMFDIIELNDTGIEESKPSSTSTPETTTKLVSLVHLNELSNTTPIPTTKVQENVSSYTTVIYYKEPPPESAQVTNKSPKKIDKQSKAQYYKKSDPKKINYQSEKDQRQNKEERYSKSLQDEINSNLNKEVDMFPVIASGGPLVKLNRTHRKEVPVIDDHEYSSDIIDKISPIDVEPINDNKLELMEEHERLEITLKERNNTSSTDIFIVTTKFIDEKQKNDASNESTTTFSEKNNETMLPVKTPVIETGATVTTALIDILIDSKLDDLNKNITQNNESEILPIISEDETNKSIFPWGKDDEIMSKSLLGEVDAITDDVIEKNISSPGNPTSDPLNSEPVTPQRPNRRRKLTNDQRRSFYPYFFSRVLG